jgi:hypothetical protein
MHMKNNSISGRILLIFIFNILFFSVSAQEGAFLFLKTESQLKEYFTELYKSENDKTTDSINNVIFDVFSTALLIPESFSYKWTSLNMIGQIHSENEKLNVYTWYVKNNKGAYRYYGFVQYNIGSKKKPEIRFYSLTDKTKGMKNPETLTLSTDNWLGCVYYNMHTFSYRRVNYYTLLGYNFNNDFSDKKYIDILVFDKEGLPSFGGEFQLELQKVKRVIFEYSAELVASIKYDETLQMIVCDHLSPFEEMFTGNYRFYGPDGSYDGFLFNKGTFLIKRDIDARNVMK